MTSFTRKLYSDHPAAALELHRRELLQYRSGRYHVTAPALGVVSFGTRETPPTGTAYFVSAPELGLPTRVLHASDSFAARRQYADHYKVAVVEVMAVSREQRPAQS